MTALEKLKGYLAGNAEAENGEQDGLLTLCLDAAAAYLLSVTYRAVLPTELTDAQARLALVLYNRRGMEGETAHAEGSVSRSIDPADVPTGIQNEAMAYRLLPSARRARQVVSGE